MAAKNSTGTTHSLDQAMADCMQAVDAAEMPRRKKAEEENTRSGFQPFQWLNAGARTRHGASMTEAFNTARSVLHGNAALLELLEDESHVPRDRGLGVVRTGDVMRFLVTVNQVVAERLGELGDEINKEADRAIAGIVDFDARR